MNGLANPSPLGFAHSTRSFGAWVLWMVFHGVVMLSWAVMPTAPAQAQPQAGKRVALVIGNDQYDRFLKLRNAAQDARSVAQALRDVGFQVPDKWVVVDASRQRMADAVQDFVASITPQDEAVFFFSGHGVEVRAQAALLPVDARDPSRRPADGSLRPLDEIELAEQQVLDESLTINRVAAQIAGRRPKFSLLVVDACRDNPVLDLLKRAHAANPSKSAGPPPEVGLIAEPAARTQVLLFSASKGQQSLDRLSNSDPVPNGVFTRVLLNAMRQRGLGLRDLLPQVSDEVTRLASTRVVNGKPHVQEPRSMASYDAPNFFFLSPLAPVTPDNRQRIEDDAWALCQAATERSPCDDYLSGWPQGRYLARARARLMEVQMRPAPSPAGPVASQVVKDCALCPEMVVIPAGVFTMGSPASEPGRASDEGPQRSVRLQSFLLGRTEVTQGQWKAVMGSNPSRFSACGDDCPVENVSWDDAQEFIRKLNAQSGQRYRLPSEAEWEYAARAGTTTPFATGQTIRPSQANFDGSTSYNGSVKGEYRERVNRVGAFAPNAWGLHDMHGNLWEWVQDVWYADYAGAPTDGSARTSGESPSRRVLRGGSWGNGPQFVRSATRYKIGPAYRDGNTGLRVARAL